MDRFEKMKSMFPSQFRNKPLIEAYVRALAKQFDEVEQMFWELDNITDVETAEGEQLDRIGDMVVLSRKEAAFLVDDDSGYYVMEDDVYRRFLKYKILKNTNRCTYDDLMDGLELVWNTDRLQYVEEAENPATIIFSTGVMSLDEADIVFHRNLCIKASGVLLLLRKIFYDFFEVKLRIETALSVSCEVYARNNRVPLYLDGSWCLDGTYDLHGYMDDNDFDFYPTTLYIGTEVEINKAIETNVLIDSCVSSMPNYENCLSVGIKIDVGKQLENAVLISTPIEAALDIECGLTVEKDLWYLDGTYALDGTKILDAEIIILDL